jgi:hypothetical protein
VTESPSRLALSRLTLPPEPVFQSCPVVVPVWTVNSRSVPSHVSADGARALCGPSTRAATVVPADVPVVRQTVWKEFGLFDSRWTLVKYTPSARGTISATLGATAAVAAAKTIWFVPALVPFVRHTWSLPTPATK